METVKENRKIKYTKMAIKESFFKLLAEKPLTQISVKSICDMADINRGTFYAHYSDIHDLVHKLEQEMVEVSKTIIDMDEIGKSDQFELYKGIFSNIKNNIQDYKIMLLHPSSVHSLDGLLTDIYEHHAAALRKNKAISDNMIDYSFAFLKQGCMQVLYKWIENGFKESPDEMAKLIVGIIQNGIQSV